MDALKASKFVKWDFGAVVTVTLWLRQSAPTRMDLKCPPPKNKLPSAAFLADLNVSAAEASGDR